jgi:hypothetical protein
MSETNGQESNSRLDRVESALGLIEQGHREFHERIERLEAQQ